MKKQIVKKPKIKLTQIQLSELDVLKEDLECSVTELKRVQAILLIDCESTCQFIKALTGYKKKYASALRQKYIKGGILALKDKKRPQKENPSIPMIINCHIASGEEMKAPLATIVAITQNINNWT